MSDGTLMPKQLEWCRQQFKHCGVFIFAVMERTKTTRQQKGIPHEMAS